MVPGASDHICSTLASFHSYTPTKNPDHHITIPHGRQILVLNVGSVQLTKDIMVTNVLHIPDFEFNLISVNKLCHDLNCQITFTHDSCFLQGHTGPSMLLSRFKGGLYNVDSSLTPQKPLLSSHASCFSALDTAKLWHLRLGHLPFKQITHVLPDCIVKSCHHDIICLSMPSC